MDPSRRGTPPPDLCYLYGARQAIGIWPIYTPYVKARPSWTQEVCFPAPTVRGRPRLRNACGRNKWIRIDRLRIHLLVPPLKCLRQLIVLNSTMVGSLVAKKLMVIDGVPSPFSVLRSVFSASSFYVLPIAYTHMVTRLLTKKRILLSGTAPCVAFQSAIAS